MTDGKATDQLEVGTESMRPRKRGEVQKQWTQWARATAAMRRPITLRRGRDYTCSIETLRNAALDTAKRLDMAYGMKVISEDEVKVEFGYDPTPLDERQMESEAST
jgi:hypothetical protein